MSWYERYGWKPIALLIIVVAGAALLSVPSLLGTPLIYITLIFTATSITLRRRATRSSAKLKSSESEPTRESHERQ